MIFAIVLGDADVVIDFSTASAAEEHLRACREAKKPLLLGTTGHGARKAAALRGCGTRDRALGCAQHESWRDAPP